MNSGHAVTEITTLPIAEAPLGLVLDSVHPHEALNRLFASWESPLAAPGLWRMPSLMEIVTLPEGEKALRFNLQYVDPTGESRGTLAMRYDRALVTREAVPGDATITATVTMENPITTATDDNDSLIRPWVGIVGRMQDVRHYYFLCLEYPDAVMLYLRDDELWIPLGRYDLPISCGDSHELALVMRASRLEGWIDGKRGIAATNYQYTRGKAGLRANCTSHVTGLAIQATPKAASRHQAAVQAEREEIEQLARGLPKPVLSQSLDLRGLGEVAEVRFGDFVGSGQAPQLLVALRKSEDGSTHVLRTLAGETLWKARLPGLSEFILTEPGAEGQRDLFGISDQELLLVSGLSGEVMVRRPLPSLPDRPRLTWGFLPASPVNLSGGPQARQFLLRDRWPEMGNDGERPGRWMKSCGFSGISDPPSGSATAAASGPGGVEWRWTGGGAGRSDPPLAEGRGPLATSRGGGDVRCLGGGHVDALALGFFSEPEDGPVAHLQLG